MAMVHTDLTVWRHLAEHGKDSRLSRRYGSRLTCWVSTLRKDATHLVRSPVNVVPVSSLGVSLPEGSDMLDHR
jgi:hypothetical protein